MPALDLNDDAEGEGAKMGGSCKVLKNNPEVYKTEDGRVYVDFMYEDRFDIVEWVALVRRVNDEILKLTMNGGDGFSRLQRLFCRYVQRMQRRD
jgi:hypothetical protein